MLSGIFGSNQETTEVYTSTLKVIGKSLIFENTLYPIDNLSVISVGEIKKSLPFMFYVFLAGGVLLVVQPILGIISLGLAGLISLGLAGLIFFSFVSNKEHGLYLVTNSRESTLIISRDSEFLIRVVLSLHAVINGELDKSIVYNFDQRQIIEIGEMKDSAFVAGNVKGNLVNSI